MNIAGVLARMVATGATPSETLIALKEEIDSTSAYGKADVSVSQLKPLVEYILADEQFWHQTLTPLDLKSFVTSGKAGLVAFLRDELLATLTARSVDQPIGPAWLEAFPLDEEHMVAYPQSAEMTAQLALWLPVTEGPGVCRMVPLNMGLGDDLRTIAGYACHPGWEGTDNFTQTCLPADLCPHPCQGKWVLWRNERLLVGCDC